MLNYLLKKKKKKINKKQISHYNYLLEKYFDTKFLFESIIGLDQCFSNFFECGTLFRLEGKHGTRQFCDAS